MKGLPEWQCIVLYPIQATLPDSRKGRSTVSLTFLFCNIHPHYFPQEFECHLFRFQKCVLIVFRQLERWWLVLLLLSSHIPSTVCLQLLFCIIISPNYLDMLTWEFIKVLCLCFGFCLSFCLLGPYPWHMEVPRLGLKLELQLPAYATATATRDLSLICDLHHSSWQGWILNPLSEARDQTHVLLYASWVC